MSELDLFVIKAILGWCGGCLCCILFALGRWIIVKRKKDELELEQWKASLK